MKENDSKKNGAMLKSGVLLVLLNVVLCNYSAGQSGRLLAIDINSSRVLLDSLAIKQKQRFVIDTLKFKFDVFSTYSNCFDSRSHSYLLECDTAILVFNEGGRLLRTIHKPGEVEGLVYDPVKDKIYCVLWTVNTFHFAELDVATGVFKRLRSLSANALHTATLDYDNGFYYIISDTRGLYKIDVLTGIKRDSTKYFTTANCRCNTFDNENGKMATICNVAGKDVMQLYDPVTKGLTVLDTLNKYGNGYFGFESAALDQNNGNWYINLGKKIGVKNIRKNSLMDTFYIPFNRIRNLAWTEDRCYRPMVVAGFSKQNPKCQNAENGTGAIVVSGGRPGRSYALNGGAPDTGSVFKNLKAGQHEINVKDRYGFCSLNYKFSLADPPEFTVVKSSDTVLCKGQSMRLNLFQANAVSYHLTSNTGVKKNTDTCTLWQAGTYYVEIKNANQCPGRDTFTIQKVDLEVSHDFLVPSNAFAGDTVYAVNISSHDADENLWRMSRDAKFVFKKDISTMGYLFADTGEYRITLKSRYQVCGYELTKPVTIRFKTDSLALNPKFGVMAPMIESFQVSPNPNDGEHFEISLRLRDTVNFSVFKIESATGYISGEMHFNGQRNVVFKAFTSMRSEVFYLKLLVGKESRVIKVVVVR